MEIIVPSQKIPVMAECDLLVCGAGPAGICAAVSAARNGLRVVLLERWFFAGGMGTASLLGQFHTSDREKEVIQGFMREMFERGMRRGWCRRYPHYPKNHETHEFDIEGLKILYEEMLAEAKVKVLYTMVAGDVILDGPRISAVLCDTKTGRKALKARFFIDATGDGDVAAKAGVPFEFGRKEDGLVQGMTLIYKLQDIDREKVAATSPEVYRQIVSRMKELAATGAFPPVGPISFECYAAGGYPNMNPVSGNPLDESSLTACAIRARRQMHVYVDYFRKNVPGFEQVKVAFSAPSLGIRESRRIHGIKTLSAEDIVKSREQSDAVGHGCWMIDIHDPKGSGRTTWEQGFGQLPPGRSYHIPYGMMVPVKFDNLLVAGRCASSTHEGHASVRVMSHCIVMGQASGTAASLALERTVAAGKVPIAELQKRLKAQGVYLEKP